MGVIGKDFCEEAGLGVQGLLDARLGEGTGRRLSVKSRSAVDKCRINPFSYLSGTGFWSSGAA